MHRDLFSAAGGLREHLDAVDWSSSPLGPVDQWSPTLRNSVDLMLHSRFAMTLLWGPEFALVYNDAYIPMIGDKHPAALGAPAREVFAEAWDQIGPMMAEVARTGAAEHIEDALVPLERHGFLEECYFTFSYSAVRGSEGTIEGVIDVVTETTKPVKARRRVEVLARLSERLVDATSIDAVRRGALTVLQQFADDFDTVDLRLSETDPADWAAQLPSSLPPGLSTQGLVVDGQTPGSHIAWALVEPAVAGRAPSVLAARMNPRVLVDDDLRDLLGLTATVIGRALARVRADIAAGIRHDLERQLSETLQRSLLSRPAQLDGLRVAVRYVPAASEAQVGGDWYDAFELPSGELSLVVGDITGHDSDAAASMAQVRNVLRGVSMTLPATPAPVLTALETALHGLAIDVIATSIVVHVARPDGEGDDRWSLRWSNAGHPPPVLVSPDGAVELLDARPDPLLGAGLFERHDHVVTVAPGSTVVLYTDGLIERRGQVLDEGFAWLEAVLAQSPRDAEAICDLLIEQMSPGVEDDVVLLVLSVG